MVPVKYTNGTLEHSNLTYNNIDKLSISNIPIGSHRNVPPDPDESVSELVKHFFLVKKMFFIKQTGFLGLSGKSVDAIDFYTSEIERPSKEMVVDDIGDVTITNDGAIILKMLDVEHLAAKTEE